MEHHTSRGCPQHVRCRRLQYGQRLRVHYSAVLLHPAVPQRHVHDGSWGFLCGPMPAVPGGLLCHKSLRQRVHLFLSGGHLQHEPGDDVLGSLQTMCGGHLQLRAGGLGVFCVYGQHLFARGSLRLHQLHKQHGLCGWFYHLYLKRGLLQPWGQSDGVLSLQPRPDFGGCV